MANLNSSSKWLIQPARSGRWLPSVVLLVTIVGCGSPQANQSPATVTAVSNDEVNRYAKTVRAIEASRQATVAEITRLTQSDQMPDVACDQPSTVQKLPDNLQAIVVSYCKQAKQVGETNGFTMSRFNAITANLETNPELAKRIQAELTSLRLPTIPAPGSPNPLQPSPPSNPGAQSPGSTETPVEEAPAPSPT